MPIHTHRFIDKEIKLSGGAILLYLLVPQLPVSRHNPIVDFDELLARQLLNRTLYFLHRCHRKNLLRFRKIQTTK